MRKAFTLIEMLIALPIALVVLGAATIAVRTAAKTAAVANQLARENAAIVAGYEAAMNEVDFWYCMDDPADASGQQLRKGWVSQTVTGTIGSAGTTGQPFVPVALPAGFWNRAVWDPKTWPHMGFSKAVNGSGGDFAYIGNVKHPDPIGRWQHWVDDRLFWSLGWAGWNDYRIGCMPPVAYLAPYSGGDTRPRNSFDQPVPRSTLSDGGGSIWTVAAQAVDAINPTLVNGEIKWTPNLGSKAILAQGAQIWFAPRDGYTRLLGAGNDPMYYKASGMSLAGYTPNLNFVGQWYDRLFAGPVQTRVTAPGHPEVRIGVGRYAKRIAGTVTMVDIQVFNPVTGTLRQVRFWTDGSTLRGARQQRMWSHWGGATLDTVAPEPPAP